MTKNEIDARYWSEYGVIDTHLNGSNCRDLNASSEQKQCEETYDKLIARLKSNKMMNDEMMTAMHGRRDTLEYKMDDIVDNDEENEDDKHLGRFIIEPAKSSSILDAGSPRTSCTNTPIAHNETNGYIGRFLVDNNEEFHKINEEFHKIWESLNALNKSVEEIKVRPY
eukprot:UN12764